MNINDEFRKFSTNFVITIYVIYKDDSYLWSNEKLKLKTWIWRWWHFETCWLKNIL